MLDLGVYVIQLCQFLFRRMPESIEATGTVNPKGVDIEMQATLRYSNDAVATVSSSSVRMLSNVATIKGTKGELEVR